MNNNEYHICSRCILDTENAPDIYFDEDGVCNYCHDYDKKVAVQGYKPGESEKKLQAIVDKMKKDGRSKEYDCVLGISGGVDSAYMAYYATKVLHLRILAVHVDAGWNSDTAVENIKKMCSALKMDLHTVVVDWPTMKELQRAFMFSGLKNLDQPQDMAFIAAVYHYAIQSKIKYILNGDNLATEGILPPNMTGGMTDWTFIKDVYKKHGRGKISLKKYPHLNWLETINNYKNIFGNFQRVTLLNYIPYSKKEAIETLKREFDWNYYGGKHYESRFTKFFQGYYQPQKFHFDKRRAHLSSLVVGGEMTRDEALKAIEDTSEYPAEQMLEDKEYILKKLDISDEEWDEIMKAPSKDFSDYRSRKSTPVFLKQIYNKVHGA